MSAAVTQQPVIASIPGLAAALAGKGALTGGNSWTGAQVITGALACTNNLQVAGGTKVASQPMGDFYETWNNAAVTFTGFQINITDAASAAGSLLMDLKAAGASRFSVKKSGDVQVTGESIVSTSTYFSLGTGVVPCLWMRSGGVYAQVGIIGNLGFEPTLTGLPDIVIGRGAAGRLDFTNSSGELRDWKARRGYLMAGTSASLVNPGGTLAVDTTQTGNVGAGVDTLQTYSVPANCLAVNGDRINFEFAGTWGNNANNKQLVLKFGSTTLISTDVSPYGLTSETSWAVKGTIIRTGAATQKAVCVLTFDGADAPAPLVKKSSPAETLSGAVTLLLTGEGVSDNDIVKEIFTLDYNPAP